MHRDNAPFTSFFFTRELLAKYNMTVVPPILLFCFLRLKIKLKGRHFDKIEVMKAESQVVPNTVTEHDFQDAFKIWQKSWEWSIRPEGDYFEGDFGQ
jgi:hypothetical protein